MPEFDIIFAAFPTEEHFLPGDKGWEIDKATVQIFDLNLTMIEALKNFANFGKGLDIAIYHFPAEVHSQGQFLCELFVEMVQQVAGLAEFVKPFRNLRKELASFVAGVVLAELRHC